MWVNVWAKAAKAMGLPPTAKARGLPSLKGQHQWAVQEARKTRDVDKTDEIRIWALARQQQGLPAESDDWKRAYSESEAAQ